MNIGVIGGDIVGLTSSRSWKRVRMTPRVCWSSDAETGGLRET